MNFPFLFQGHRRGSLTAITAPRPGATAAADIRRVHPTTPAGLVHDTLRASRKTFWRVYGEWMSAATQLEIDQLEVALVAHAPHVRSIHVAIADAMRDRESSMAMPLSLLAALDVAHWNPDAWMECAATDRRAA